MPRYALSRIIGNELPPRDRLHGRIDAIRFILQNETLPENWGRFWLLNRIHDPEYRAEVLRLLEEHGETTGELPFELDRYGDLGSFKEKVLYAVNVNSARNHVFAVGRRSSRFVFVLDGDCVFRTRELTDIDASIQKDQRAHPDRRHYSLPMIRASAQEIINGDPGDEYLEEPQLAFRDDAEILFDESLAFGNNDKVELLLRLGHKPYVEGQLQEHPLEHERLCLSIGQVFHLHTGGRASEEDRIERGVRREVSLRRLVESLDGRTPKPKSLAARLKRLLDSKPLAEDYMITNERSRACFKHFGLDGETALVYGELGGGAALPMELVAALKRCQHFDSAAGHALFLKRRMFWAAFRRLERLSAAALGRPGPRTGALSQLIENLSREGIFIPWKEEFFRHRNADASKIEPIQTIAIAAGDEAAADRAVGAIRRLERLYGETRDVLIIGAAPSTEQRDRPHVRLAGDRERSALAAALVREGIPEAVARFALLSDGPARGTLRNYALLSYAGERLFCCDAASLEDWTPVPGYDGIPGPLRAHDRALGARCAALRPDMSALKTPFLRRLISGRDRIAATFHGCADSRGTDLLCRDAVEREARLRERSVSPQDSRLSGGYRVRDAIFCASGFLGLDNRTLLPPFPPVAGNDWSVFAAAADLCLSDRVCAQVPWTLSRPVDGMPSEAIQRSGLQLSDLLIHLRPAEGLSPALGDDGRRLKALGDYWRQIASLPLEEYEQQVRLHLARGLSPLARAYSEFAQANALRWPYWDGEDMANILTALQRDMTRDEYVVPTELRSGSTLRDARENTRRFVASFGELLSWWPAMFDAAARAKEPRDDGRRTAR